MSQFQLFPPPSPEGKASTNPFRKEKKKQENKQPQSPIPLEDMKGSKTEGVIFQIIEDTNNIQPPPKAHITKSRPGPRSSSRQNARPERQASSSSAGTGSTTLVNSSNRSFESPSSQNRASPQQPRSPGLPMRSMFPRYDFNLPLNQQKYYPQSSGSRRRPPPRGLTLSPGPEIDQALGPKTVPASAMNFPAEVLDPDEIRYSSSAELKGLWEAANGQRPQNLPGIFNLRMERTEPATFTFGDSRSPFYTLNTYSTNELCISRADPSKPDTNIPIMMLNMEDRKRRDTSNDGLVTHIFSRLAAMLAVEQSSQLQKQHHLSPSEANKVESDALNRASAHESHTLTWNNSQRVYELKHASLSKQKNQQRPALVGAAGVALSPVQKRYQGTLHVTVSPSPSPSSREDDRTRKPPTISITTPTTPSSSASIEESSRAASPRTSTHPLTDSDSDESLASLDLNAMTLSISATTIISTIPSLYAIDSLVAALLAVAVSDETTNPILADLSNVHEKQWEKGRYSHKPFRGKLVTTFAEREDDDELDIPSPSPSPSPSSSSFPADNKPKRSSLNPFARTFWHRTKNPKSTSKSTPRKKEKTKNKKQVVVSEFDLEKYGRYGSGSSPEGKELPGIIRGVLRMLFWALDVVVWCLVRSVKVLAWVLVNVTRCVSSERF